VRPQSGLSFSPLVFEYYIGEGMTRFLAFYYGDLSGVKENGDLIGPVHSGRLPDEQLRQLYSGFLLISSASANVARNLYHKTDIYAKADDQIGHVMLTSEELIDVAKKEKGKLEKMGTSGMLHDDVVPPEGLEGESFWLMYSYPNQVLWRYDGQSGAYQRYQDRGDAVTFEMITDKLTGKPLEFENVIIMFVEHEAKYETMINFNLTFFKRFPAFLLRDGRLYKIFWSTTNTQEERATGRSSPIRFVDYDGHLFPLKPGQTWVQFVQPNTPYWESIDSEVYFDRVSKKEQGSGHWSMVFEPPIPLLELPSGE